MAARMRAAGRDVATELVTPSRRPVSGRRQDVDPAAPPFCVPARCDDALRKPRGSGSFRSHVTSYATG